MTRGRCKGSCNSCVGTKSTCCTLPDMALPRSDASPRDSAESLPSYTSTGSTPESGEGSGPWSGSSVHGRIGPSPSRTPLDDSSLKKSMFVQTESRSFQTVSPWIGFPTSPTRLARRNGRNSAFPPNLPLSASSGCFTRSRDTDIFSRPPRSWRVPSPMPYS